MLFSTWGPYLNARSARSMAERFCRTLDVPVSDQSIPSALSGPAEGAAYVASLAAELAILAHKAGLGSLEYLLDLVRLEAENARGQERTDRQ
jgi:hypothetical protein